MIIDIGQGALNRFATGEKLYASGLTTAQNNIDICSVQNTVTPTEHTDGYRIIDIATRIKRALTMRFTVMDVFSSDASAVSHCDRLRRGMSVLASAAFGALCLLSGTIGQ